MMAQLLAHLWGDYLLQNDWMANGKTKSWPPAAAHAIVYSLAFLALGSWRAFAVILLTHYFIDRYRLARYMVYANNWLGPVPRYAFVRCVEPKGLERSGWIREGDVSLSLFGASLLHWRRLPWEVCKETGYPSERPAWLSTWLLIIADNTLHLTINYLALRYL